MPCATPCCRSSRWRLSTSALLFGGLIITENIFEYPGLGHYFLNAYSAGDFPELMPWMVIVVLAVILFNLLADLSYAFLDPRIRLVTDILTGTLVRAEPEEHAPSTDIQGLTTKSLSPRQMAMRRFLGHKPAVVALIVLVAMVLFVLFAPLTARYGVDEAVFETTAEQSNRYLSPRADRLVRHRRDRSRPLQPADLRHAHFAVRRPLGGADRRRHRHRGRSRSPGSGADGSTTC